MTDLLIVGAGTAGLTAAVYGLRAGLSVAVLEQAIYGGQIITTTSIENYPGMPGVSGADFATALYRQAVELGAKVFFEDLTGASLAGSIKRISTEKGFYEASAVILATGAKPRKLGCPGEERWMGRGVSFCATCDGAFYRQRDVAVVGGGKVAVDDALLLAKLCRKVFLIHRSETFRAEKIQLEHLAEKKNVEIITSYQVREIASQDRLEQIVIGHTVSGAERKLAVSGVFVAIGSAPDNRLFEQELQLDPAGYFIAGEDCQTRLPGVFAAGDARTKKVRQIVTAAADGAVSAISAAEYLRGRSKSDGMD